MANAHKIMIPQGSMGNPNLRIIVDTSRLDQAAQRGVNIQPLLQRFYMVAGEETRKEMILNIRRKGAINHGNLWGGINVKPWGNGVQVGPSVAYAPYVEYGTDPSPGMFIPSIGKRYKRETVQRILAGGGDPGTHPGNKRKFGGDGARFARDAADTMRSRAPTLFRQLLQGWITSGVI